LNYSIIDYFVLEKNPPKQGLKQTFRRLKWHEQLRVLEKNPPKQGLKLLYCCPLFLFYCCFREKSTKTRIETAGAFPRKPLDGLF